VTRVGLGQARSPAPDAAVLAALLTVEHGVIYGYGVAGAVAASGAPQQPGQTGATGPVTGPADARAAAAVGQAAAGLDVHRARRDLLADRIRALGGVPPDPLAAYRLPAEPRDAAGALHLLGRLEDDVALGARHALTVAVTAPVRDLAAAVLADAAVRGARARLTAGDPPGAVLAAFPGSSGG
jgi:hypothetical protein